MSQYSRYLLKRFCYMLLTLFVIITATFFLMKLLPGTPFADEDSLSVLQLEIMNEKYGLNDPVFVQYLNYLKNVLQGDLGVTFQFNNTPVTQLLMDRAGPSLILGLQAMVFGTVFGTILGVVSALYRNRWIDHVTTFLAIAGRSMPNFVFAVILQFVFAVTLNWFPIAFWEDGFLSSVLPSIALGMAPLADSARFVRTEMIEVLNSDYIELAKAKGLSDKYIIVKHALRNAVIPLVTIIGPMTASLMTGSLVVENIFSIPGIGEQFTKSILVNDFPTIMGVTIMYSTLLVVIVLFMDIIYGWLDPRMRVVGGDQSE